MGKEGRQCGRPGKEEGERVPTLGQGQIVKACEEMIAEFGPGEALCMARGVNLAPYQLPRALV